MINSYFRFLLISFVAIDSLSPYILAHFYPKYQAISQVISELGEVGSPVYYGFSFFSILAGSILLVSLFGLVSYLKTQTSVWMSRAIAVTLASFAIGECLLSGLFSIEGGSTVSVVIHQISSDLGSLGMLGFPFLIGIFFYRKEKSSAYLFFGLGLLSVLFASINGYAQLTDSSYMGVYQRVSMLMMYLPVVMFGAKLPKVSAIKAIYGTPSYVVIN